MTKVEETHELKFIKPRPSTSELFELVKNHFDIEAENYDAFDNKNEKRLKYTESINKIIATKMYGTKKVLSIACGTGRRDLEIRKKSGVDYEIFGVEISSAMANIANSNGLQCECSNWLDSSINDHFDRIFFLYAFGAMPSSFLRLKALEKIRASLKKGQSLFLDVLNIDDYSEWGIKIKEAYKNKELEKYGYEVGDILYSKIGDERLAYWHYFSRPEIETLLKRSGFADIKITYIGYGSKFGEFVSSTEGAMFVEAQ